MTIPICPFCWGTLSFPENIRLSNTESALGGKCFLCGASYFVDPTGKNVGEAVVWGLQMAAEQLGREPAMLVSGEDYDDRVLRYDVRQHQTLGPAGKCLDRFGRLYVIRVRQR